MLNTADTNTAHAEGWDLYIVYDEKSATWRRMPLPDPGSKYKNVLELHRALLARAMGGEPFARRVFLAMQQPIKEKKKNESAPRKTRRGG